MEQKSAPPKTELQCCALPLASACPRDVVVVVVGHVDNHRTNLRCLSFKRHSPMWRRVGDKKRPEAVVCFMHGTHLHAHSFEFVRYLSQFFPGFFPFHPRIFWVVRTWVSLTWVCLLFVSLIWVCLLFGCFSYLDVSFLGASLFWVCLLLEVSLRRVCLLLGVSLTWVCHLFGCL